MARALVTGSGERAAATAELLAAAGLEVRTAADLGELSLADLPTIDHYIQLPVVVSPQGEDAVRRVRSFLEGGLLARFELVERLLPHLARNASVVLVPGNTPGRAALPDDARSRAALLEVLAHATRAELPSTEGRVTVADGASTPAQLVDLTLRGPDPTGGVAELPDARYEDWRTEVMGMVHYHG